MHKVAVITDSETATGFRLAGVEVREAAAPEVALDLIREYAAAGYGLLIVNEDLLRGTDDARARLLRGRDLPVVVPLPAPRAHLESGEAYIARLVKEHIGFAVKLK
ncbi:MAG TPA: V-type ATP synthase subunit F [bacterium]|nr:V-type ATP synthase subunit F [bacterium]